ncbi:MAG TPA: ABC transporter permease [Gammaproteobacteria bacterium]
MSGLLRNLRYALRTLARSPGFTATVVLTLALGIGANGAVFSGVDAVLLRPLPFPDPDRLVLVTQRQANSNETGIAPVRLEDWNAGNESFESLTGWTVEDASDTTGEFPERVRKAEVGPRFLATWGVSPALGRDFTAEEYRPGGPRAILIGDRYWRNRLGADPNVLGRTLRLNGVSYSVVGVMPPSFSTGADVDLWTPDWSPAAIAAGSQRFLQWYTGVGRLRAGVTLEQARAGLQVVQARLAAAYPQSDADIAPVVEPLRQVAVGGASGPLWALLGAVSLLLLIACTNVASLLLARAARREPEIAVRYSLGASRRAVIGQLLTESCVLAAAGALLGLLVAGAGTAAFRALAPDLPRSADAGLDLRLVAYLAATAVIVAVLCGLVPALRASREARALPRAGRGQVGRRHSAQWLLVGVQVALSVTLLAGTGLLLRSFDALARVEAGFDAANVLTFRISADWGESQDYDGVIRRLNATIDELAALPGVEAVATTAALPGLPSGNPIEIALVDGPAAAAERLLAEQRVVSPEYFATLGIPLLAGELCRRPAALGAIEVMVNRSFAQRYFPNRSVVGLRIASDGNGPPSRIAGVVGDARDGGLDREAGPAVYNCFSAPNVFPWFLVRTAGDPRAAAGSIRARVRELEPLRAVYELAPLDERIGGVFAEQRLLLTLLGAFGAAALALVCLGVYATLSYVVAERRREVGLRMALGALVGNVVAHFLARALGVVAVASVAGLVLSLVLGRTLSGLLYGVAPSDPAALTAAVAVVVGCAASAALLPALRAARVDPMHALREE